jgi:hypothetical protein
MTAAVEDRTQARIDGLLDAPRDAEAELRRSYARVLDVVTELDAENAGAVAGFGNYRTVVGWGVEPVEGGG